MGTLSYFDLELLRAEYDLTAMVETGTWKGYAVEYARVSGFEKIYSVELHPDFFQKAVYKFSGYPHIKIFEGASLAVLPEILHLIGDEKTLWWLDAHLHETYGLDKDLTGRFPLEEEIRLITRERNVSRDLFIMDDLRVYETGPFERGNCGQNHRNPVQGIGFVNDLLGSTHTVEKLYAHEGYILCKPKCLT